MANTPASISDTNVQRSYETINTSGNSSNVLGDVNVFLDFAKGVRGNGNSLPYIESQSVKDSLLLLAAGDRFQSSLVQQLLDQGANYKHTGVDQETALFKAVKCRSTITIDILLSEPIRATFLLNYRDFASLATPLHEACLNGFSDIVQQLLLYDAALEARQRHGDTPLMTTASMGKHDNILEALLRHGADPMAINYNNDTPVIIVARYGRIQILSRLLKIDKVRQSLEHVNNSGDNALFLATWHGKEDCARLLINSGADVHYVNKPTNTSILHTCARGDLPDLLDDILPKFTLAEMQQHSSHFKGAALDLAVSKQHGQCASIIRSHIKTRQDGPSSARSMHLRDTG